MKRRLAGVHIGEGLAETFRTARVAVEAKMFGAARDCAVRNVMEMLKKY